jgi:hypothetical protein
MKLHKINAFLFILLFFITALNIEISNTDFVSNDKVWHEYVAKKEDVKYQDEYDSYLADFQEDLKEIDLPEESSYGWDYFVMDASFILAPFAVACLGLALLLFTGFQFSNELKTIKLSTVFKSTLLAYFVFYLKDIIAIFYFLFFKTDYKFEDIQAFEGKFALHVNKLQLVDNDAWFYDILGDLSIYLLIYILLIPLFLKLTTEYSYRKIAQAMLIPFLCGFILYESVMTYLTL